MSCSTGRRGHDPGNWVARGFGAAGVAMALVVHAVALAWACVPQPLLVVLQPRASGPAGTAVQVQVIGFDRGAVEVRWNAADGPELARSTGPDFTADIVIPDAAPGLYSVVVLARQAGGGIGNAVTSAFHVTEERDAPHAAVPPTAPEREVTPARAAPRSRVPLLATGIAILAVGGIGAFGLARRRQAHR